MYLTFLCDFLWLHKWTFRYCSISFKHFHSSIASSLFQLVLKNTFASLDAGPCPRALCRVLLHAPLTPSCSSKESFHSSKVAISSPRVAGGILRSSARHTGQSQ